MKNTFSLRQLMAVVFLVTAQAALSIDVEKSFKATPPVSRWKFELKNRDKKDLYIQLKSFDKNGEKKDLLNIDQGRVEGSKGSKESQHGYLRIAGIEAGNKYKLYIWNKRDDKAYRASINPTEVYELVAKPSRKTILLTFEDGTLRPQKGNRLKGAFTGYSSASGLQIFGNIKSDDIKKSSGLEGVQVIG